MTNFKINVLLTWSPIYVTDNTTGVVTFEISDKKIHAIDSKQKKTAAATKLRFSSHISNWSKYQTKVSPQIHNSCPDYVIDTGFQRTISVFLLSFEDDTVTIEQV